MWCHPQGPRGEFRAGLEVRQALRADVDDLAGAWVASPVCPVASNLEGSEIADFDLLAAADGLLHAIEGHVNQQLRTRPGNLSLSAMTAIMSALVMVTDWLLHFSAIFTRSPWLARVGSVKIPRVCVRRRRGRLGCGESYVTR